MVSSLRLLAYALWAITAAAVVIGIGMIIFNGGRWPDSLATVQNLFQTLHASFGPLGWIIQVVLFVGPGMLVWWLADYLEVRKRRQNSN
jgi:hypothetical protein